MRRDFADRGSWRGRDGNDPSVDIAKDADHRFWRWSRRRPLPPPAAALRELGQLSAPSGVSLVVRGRPKPMPSVMPSGNVIISGSPTK